MLSCPIYSPYFNAGFGLMVMGVGLTFLRQAAVLGSTALRRRMLVTLEISNRDRAYEWILAWMTHKGAHNSKPPQMRSHQLSVETSFQQHKNGSPSALFNLVAGPGVHWLKYRGAWMQVCQRRLTNTFFLCISKSLQT